MFTLLILLCVMLSLILSAVSMIFEICIYVGIIFVIYWLIRNMFFENEF